MRKAIRHLKSADPVMRSIIERVGPYEIVYHPPEFSTLARSIIYQQLSGKVAKVIHDRVLAAAAPDGALDSGLLLSLEVPRLRSLGLSQRKAEYLRAIAEAAHSGQLDFAALGALEDEEIIARLSAIRGVGRWTAQMFLIFALQRPDVLPTGDLGVRSAVRKAYGLEDLPAEAELVEIARPWRPWASVASWYLWRSLDGPAAL